MFSLDHFASRSQSQILSFWTSITQYLRTQKAHAIEAFEEFIVAGLTSPRKSIVNTTITFWNDILLEIGESAVECSERIIQAVQQLYHVADIRLPYGMEPDDQSVCLISFQTLSQ